jgi:Mg2+/Co2+ transporter CorB
LFICIILSYCFSGGETSVTVADLAKLHRLKMQGNKKVDLVIRLKNRKEEVISSILLGNNLVNILSSSIATFLAIKLFGSMGIIVSAVVMTLVILIFAEILPKTYAINNPENVSIFLSRFLYFFLKLFYPVIKYINKTVNLLLVLTGGYSNKLEIISPSERIRNLILLHKKEYSQQNIQKSLEVISNIVDLTEMHVDKIMTHRDDIISINANLDEKEIIKIAVMSDYKNIPIWENRNDNFVNILNVEKLICELRKSSIVVLENCFEKVTFIPNTTLVSVQLHNFKVSKGTFAFVIDEYGNVIGIVTLSDILEEILGEPIYSHDHRDIEKIGEDTYIINAKLPVRDINKRIKTNFPTKHNQTIAGMIINEIERIPEEGEVFEIRGHKIEVLKKRNNRVVLTKIIRLVNLN